MNRRQFLLNSVGFIGGAVVGCDGFGREAPGGEAGNAPQGFVPGQLAIAFDSPARLVPINYSGLSYELAQLTDPNFFAPSNTALVALFRLLSPHGVLRLGGNSSESCWLKVERTTAAPELPPVAGPVSEHWMPRERFMIVPAAIEQLAGFLQATGWQVVYGLNFGHSSPDRLAREAEFVARRIGEHLLYFQIGNEPDFYSALNNRTRPPSWGFSDYLLEWTACAEAIAQRVPHARFGGPDVGASSTWIAQFISAAARKLGSRLVAVTGHYYAEGPPDDPRMTTARLLRTDPEVGAAAKRIAARAAQNGLVYRMTEGNSCYRGGKPGMSDAFASALWGGDYLLSLAVAGCAGVNLHGGSRQILRAALGNHMPGELVAVAGSDPKGGYYTPIAGEIDQGFTARPLFYGMLLANQFAGTVMQEVRFSTGGIDATAYAGRIGDRWRMAIFNKDSARTLNLTVQAPPGCQQGKIWRLAGPSLAATAGVSLAGAEVGSNLTWSPRVVEACAVVDGSIRIELPGDSAALLFLDA